MKEQSYLPIVLGEESGTISNIGLPQIPSALTINDQGQ